MKIKLDDNDSIKDDIDNISSQFPDDIGQSIVHESSDLADSLKELNNDKFDTKTKMSGIDLRTRLHRSEITQIMAIDVLVSFGLLPNDCIKLTMQKKRLAVSLEGKGRSEIVNIVGSDREHKEKIAAGGIGGKIKSFFGVNN